MHEQERFVPGAVASAHPRDPQSFTRGDVLAWKVVAYCAAGITVLGSAAAIIVAVTRAG